MKEPCQDAETYLALFGELNEKLLILWVNSPDLLRFVVRRGANLLDYE